MKVTIRSKSMRSKIEQRRSRNSRRFIAIEYCVPEWALSVLINGDASGLEDEDEIAIAAFLKTEKLSESNGHWAYDSENSEPYFCRRNDIHNLGDNCVDIKWIQWLDQ